METISIFEHQTLKVGDHGFTKRHCQALERFLGNNDEKTFPYYTLIHNGVKFRQFVGVLCVNNLTIEVIPKTDKDNNSKDYWRNKLIFMLSRVYKLDVKSPSEANQKTRTNSPILDVFIKRFLDEVDGLVNRGLVKCYHKVEGNQKALRGKLLVEKQLHQNYIHQERFYVRHTTYDYEHIMNRIIRQALSVVAKATQNASLRGRAASTLFNYPELKGLFITSSLFENLQFDRKTEDYRMAIKLSKLLLLHHVPNNVGQGENILALMFDMNKLWEEFVYHTLRRKLSEYEVSSQVVKRYWQLSNFKVFKTIRPDIIIKRNGNVAAIIDTKWKCPDKTPSDGDLHQMFVYSQMFRADQVPKVALVYPSVNERSLMTDAYFLKNASSCDMLYLGINKSNNEWSNTIGEIIIKWLTK